METAYAVPAEETTQYSAKQSSKKKKPGFFKRWFIKMSQEAWEDARTPISSNEVGSIKAARGLQVGPTNIDQPERALNFTVYNATGGRIVETRKYDRRKDQSNTGLYIITSDQDFGREIDKIITMESLKQ